MHDSPLAKRLSELANAVALVYLLFLVGEQYGLFDPAELVDAGKRWVAGKWDERAQWTRTLRGIRDLPETEDQ